MQHLLILLRDGSRHFEGFEVGLGQRVVQELLVNVSHEVRVSHQVSWRNSVFISQSFNLFSAQRNSQELHGGRQPRYKLIFDTEPASKLIIILKKCL